jgi:hypothetical protein
MGLCGRRAARSRSTNRSLAVALLVGDLATFPLHARFIDDLSVPTAIGSVLWAVRQRIVAQPGTSIAGRAHVCS